MKKIFCLALILALLLASCGIASDDQNSSSVSSENAESSQTSEGSEAAESSENAESSQTSEGSEAVESSENAESSESSDAPEENGFELNADEIKYIHIQTDLPTVDLKSYSYSDILRLTDYFSRLELEDEFSENPDEYTGMAYLLLIKFNDGSQREFVQFDEFIKELGGEWKKMTREQGRELAEIIESIKSALPEIDVEALIEEASLAVGEVYPTVKNDSYRVDVNSHSDGSKHYVKFELEIYGYRTWESYTAVFDHKGEFIEIRSSNENEYSRYIPFVSEESVKNAENALGDKLEEYGKTGAGYYIEIDSEGYLCLATEIIVDIEPPVAGENGEVIGGCGYDHEHIFFSERISSQAFGE